MYASSSVFIFLLYFIGFTIVMYLESPNYALKFMLRMIFYLP